MPVTLVTGKLGAGKTLVSVGKIRDALLSGRRVATNLDLTLEALLPSGARKVDCVRLPDKPSVVDLELLGLGNPSMDEGLNGLIVLDELGTWLNSRQWGDKGRQGVIDWLLHSRKFGWDIVFLCQHQSLIDKQVREAVVEFVCNCRRLDRLKIPFVGWLVHLLSLGFFSGRLPQIHIGVVRYGTAVDALVTDRWVYTGRSLYAGFNTRQVFSDKYPYGAFSYLSPWHLVGRHRVPWWPGWAVVWQAFGFGPNGGKPIGWKPPVRRRVDRVVLAPGKRGPQLLPVAAAVRRALCGRAGADVSARSAGAAGAALT